MTKINNLKRQGYKSRTSLKRKFENIDIKKEKRRRLENESEGHFLHSLLKETMFTNVKKCVRCLSNVHSATEINEDHRLFSEETINLETTFTHRRFGQFWLCKFCDEKNPTDLAVRSSIFELKAATVPNGTTVFIPNLIQDENDGDVENENEAEEHRVLDPRSKVSFPNGNESLNSFPEVQFKSQSGFQIQQLLHKGNNISCDTLTLLYEHQLNKYKRSKSRQELFVGQVVNEETRTLASLKLCSTDKSISGSSLWYNKQDSDVKWKMKQLGPFALFVEIKLPLNSSTIASVLSQNGKAISVELIGAVSQEFSRVYQVHMSHGSETDCTGHDCDKVQLKDYLLENDVDLALTNRNLSTYALASDMFIKSFISNIIKSPASSLFASDYHLQTVFNDDGLMRAIGVTWPEKMKKMNLITLDNDINDADKTAVQKEYLEFVGNNISTTSDASVLKEKFHMSENESQKVAALVAKYQIHFCQNCPKCEDPDLPSLELSLTVAIKTPGNSVTTTRLRSLFIGKLKNLSFDDLQNLETLEWIEELSELLERTETNGDIWCFQFEDEEFELKMDDVLIGLLMKYENCPLAAAYQYSIICVPPPDQHKVILRRARLIESFTEPYNVFYLKAADSQISVKSLRGVGEFKKFKFSDTIPFSYPEIGLPHHSNISPTEILCLSDETVKCVKTSATVEYLSTGPEAMKLFKKVDRKSDKSYSVNGENLHLELQESKVTKYFKRLNGLDLLLSEFTVLFDFLGDEKSESLFEVYKEKLDKIENSLEMTIMGKEPIPELILLENGNVFQKRKKPKFLQYPDFDIDSYEHRYSQLLLFGSDLNFEDLNKEFVDRKFEENDEDGVNKLKKNRLRFLRKMRGGESKDARKDYH